MSVMDADQRVVIYLWVGYRGSSFPVTLPTIVTKQKYKQKGDTSILLHLNVNTIVAA